MNDDDARLDGEVAGFLDQARWLLEWHNRRGEAMATRATAILGFVGVVMTLLLQGASTDGFDAEWWTWVVLSLTLVLLIAAGGFALLVVLPTDTQMPSVGQLRKWWSQQIDDPARGMNRAQIAESILQGQARVPGSPISDAMAGASRRASLFKASAASLLATLIPLSGLIVDVLVRSGG